MGMDELPVPVIGLLDHRKNIRGSSKNKVRRSIFKTISVVLLC